MKEPESLLVILSDTISTRLYLETGILQGLAERSPMRLVVMTFAAWVDIEKLSKRFEGVVFHDFHTVLKSRRLSLLQKVLFMMDERLERHFGYIPMAIRFSMIHKFNDERFRKGHRNPYFNLDSMGPAPTWRLCLNLMRRWYFSPLRYVHPSIPEFLERENVRAILFGNCQSSPVHGYMFAAKRMGIPLIGGVASWDHPVGKGLVPTVFGWYLVQNRMMRDQLIEYHHIPAGKIQITGWPQMDKYVMNNSLPEYEKVMRRWGLEPAKPCVLMAGNSEINSPYEPISFRRLVDWRDNTKGVDAFTVIVRPHPKDFRWRERYGELIGRKGVHVQAGTVGDMDDLAVLLGHVACVVCTAGTILVDSIANDRPVVGLMYDEENRDTADYAAKNYDLYNYRTIMQSDAFVRARSFEQAVAGIESALSDPGERASERAKLSELLIGEMDGNRTSALVTAILDSIPEN